MDEPCTLNRNTKKFRQPKNVSPACGSSAECDRWRDRSDVSSDGRTSFANYMLQFSQAAVLGYKS